MAGSGVHGIFPLDGTALELGAGPCRVQEGTEWARKAGDSRLASPDRGQALDMFQCGRDREAGARSYGLIAQVNRPF